jgi:hypothetical protein
VEGQGLGDTINPILQISKTYTNNDNPNLAGLSKKYTGLSGNNNNRCNAASNLALQLLIGSCSNN